MEQKNQPNVIYFEEVEFTEPTEIEPMDPKVREEYIKRYGIHPEIRPGETPETMDMQLARLEGKVPLKEMKAHIAKEEELLEASLKVRPFEEWKRDWEEVLSILQEAQERKSKQAME